MSTADPSAAGQDVWQPKGNPWIIAVAMSLTAFMEVLATSIANVALPQNGRAATNMALPLRQCGLKNTLST